MRFLDRLRLVASFAREAYDSVPRWARIVSVDRRFGPLTRIGLEIHQGGEPPFEVSTLTWVPRRVKPQVGQDVAFRISTGDDHTYYEVVWDQPPNYGGPRPVLDQDWVERARRRP
jgi:hypothetical protein